MTEESSSTPPKIIPRAAVAFIQRPDGRILCVWNRRYEGWALPGGKVEPGETPGRRREVGGHHVCSSR